MGSLRSWCRTPSRRSTSRVASGTCSPGPSRSYVATAARSPSPSEGSGKADGQDRRGGGANGPGAVRRADPGLPRFRAPGEPNVGRGGALRTHLCQPPGVPRRALLSLCRRRQRPRALLLRTDAEVLRTAASPTLASPTGSTRPTLVPFWRRPTNCKPAKEIGEERAPSTPAILSSGVYIILLDVPDREAHGVTPSLTPVCGVGSLGVLGALVSIISIYKRNGR